MLTAVFPQLERSKFTQVVRAFFRSPAYPFLIAALMAVSEVFAWELPVYYIYLFIGACCTLFCEDALGILPIACCSYMTFAFVNNPEHDKAAANTLFSDPSNLIQLVFILAIAAILLIGRLIAFQIEHPTRKIPFLTIGFAVLLVAYMLAGVGFHGEVAVGGKPTAVEYDAAKAIPFAILQVLSLSVFYFYFYYSVDWEKVDKSYLFTLFIAIGVGLLCEIAEMYTHPGALTQAEGGGWKVDRGKLVGTGWGIYNNVGCVMAMCVPAPFYFAVKNQKWGWAYSILGCVFMLGVALTQSRGAILFGAVVFLACIITVLVKAKGKNRLFNGIVFGAMLLAIVIAMIIFREVFEKISAMVGTFMKYFRSLFSGEDVDVGTLTDQLSSGRLHQYAASWKVFMTRPSFGVGFHNIGDGGYSRSNTLLIPPRVHNTILQLLAGGGIVALLAYLFHRGQTIYLWLRHPSFEKTMAFYIIAAMLLTSLLDCHVFNYGPGRLYGCVLVYMERRGNAELKTEHLRSSRP